MPHNSTAMIHNARQDFERLLSAVHQHAHQASTAYQVERDLFTRLLALGRALLAIFFALAAQRWTRPRDAAGRPLHSHKRRRYVSLFGELVIERPYFWQAGAAGAFPMDQALSLPRDAYSDLLREQAELLASQMAYAETARVLEHLLGVCLSPHSLLRLVETDAQAVGAFYEQQAAPAPELEGELLVLQADGKGVPMRPASQAAQPAMPVRLRRGQSRTRKQEALVTSLYTTSPRVRSAEAVLASFFSGEPGPPEAVPEARPCSKKLFATLQGKQVALQRLARQVRRRDGPHLTDRVALSDGCPALQRRLRAQFPDFELVLDFVHVSEDLWKAANALFDEADPARERWVQARTEELLTGQHAQVVAQLRAQSQSEQDPLAQVARYFERNAAQMDYGRYLARGWPIASGVIEGACRHLVKDRCEAAGMRWSPAGAEQILALRAVEINGDWVSYHAYRRRVRHRRLYGCPLEQAEAPEERTLRWAA